MTATVSTLMRHADPSGVSGTGPIGTVVEFGSGLTAFHWDTDTPSVTVYTDVRHVLQLHGHQGASTLVAFETRLERAYKRVVPHLLSDLRIPVTCAPHPDHLDRLRLTFKSEPIWRFWIALLDGSTDAASHEEQNGELRHRWISPDGDLFLEWFESPARATETDLQIFDREDR